MIIMDKLTLEQAYDGHVALWDCLAQTGCDNKSKWPGWANYDRKAVQACFACEIDKQKTNDCANCPINWLYSDFCSDTGLFGRWRSAPDINTRKEIAAQIRDLPWRKKA